MYTYIKGKLIQADPSHAIVEAGGIGYLVKISPGCFTRLPQAGQTVQLFTSFIVRENSQTLYGFLGVDERDVFDVLMNVSGIGPKLALSLVGHMTLTDLQTAVGKSDALSISKVPGIGKKTAERLIVEMRDKLPNMFHKKTADYAVSFPKGSRMQIAHDVAGALVNLGYHHTKAQKAAAQVVDTHAESEDLSFLIRESLKAVQ